MNIRVGQGVAVSVALMTGLTLALGLALYSYFTAHYSKSAYEERIDIIKTRLASVLEYALVYHSSGSMGGLEVACSMMKLYNNGDQPLTLYITVLPLQTTFNSITVTPDIARYPIDQSTGDTTAYMYEVKDADADGIKDIVGSDIIPLTTLSSCSNFISDTSLLSKSLAPEIVDPAEIVISEITLKELANQQGSTLPYGIPVWRITIDPLKAHHILVVVTGDDVPEIYFTIMFKVDYKLIDLTVVKLS